MNTLTIDQINQMLDSGDDTGAQDDYSHLYARGVNEIARLMHGRSLGDPITDAQCRELLALIEEITHVTYNYETPCTDGHDNQIVYIVMRDGRKQYKHQCKRCKVRGPSVKLSSMTADELRSAPEAQEYQRRDFSGYQRANQDLRAYVSDLRYRHYEAYLKTAKWAVLRETVLKRDRHVCRGCGGYAKQAHHLTYAHLGNEFLFELIAVCAECHRRIHEQQ